MEQNPNQQPPEETQTPQEIIITHEPSSATQDSVLLDAADMSGYDKNLKNARTWLYVITGFQILMGVYEAFSMKDTDPSLAWLVFGIDAGIGLIFLACALWSYKKPYAAFITALVMYLLVTVSLMVLDTRNIGFGIVIKIFVVIALIRAIKDAREMEDLKSSFNIYS